MNPNGIAGKTAVITGASRGIGAATARLLAAAGASRLVLHYSSYLEGAAQLAAELTSCQVDLIGADLATDAGLTAFINQLKATAPDADILINNAGHLVQRAKMPEFTFDLYDRVMTLNTKSVYFITQALAPGMIAKGSGHVINLSSITKGLAKELAPAGIRVNAVSPGTVDNYFHEKYSTQQMLDNVKAQTPAGRLQTNEEIAAVIAFLLSDAASGIHGQTIEINGGMYMV